jgi:DNA-binding response OmpR family regulator
MIKVNKILVVDDDPSIRKFVRANLEARNYQVLLAADGEEAIQIIEETLPDLILLDIMMPKLDGFEVCRLLREWSTIPIVMLTAKDREADKVKFLDAGADDYLTKPFSLKELLARIKAVLRRVSVPDEIIKMPRYSNDNLEVDFLRNRVFLSGDEISLTKIEYKILSYLVMNAGRVISSDQILAKVWGDEYLGESHIVQVNINRLRKSLNDTGYQSKYIETRQGIGYLVKSTN